MRAGKLDQRIQLLRRTVAAADSNGTRVQTFERYTTVWAEKIDAGGREYFAGQQTQSELAIRFRIRYRPEVSATDRIVHRELNYNISHIQYIGRQEEILLFATAIAH